jgi:hypothetical protein
MSPRGYIGPIMRFEKIWIDQCRATRAIKRRFGAKDALDYLVGEKLRMFVKAATEDAAFARELPRFLAAICRRQGSTRSSRRSRNHLPRFVSIAGWLGSLRSGSLRHSCG